MKGGRQAKASAAEKATRRPAVAAPAAAGRVPAWAVPAVYLAVTIALFPEFVFSGGDLLGIDTHALSYFARDFYTTFVRETGRFPHWQPYVLGGIPFVEGMHGDIFYPPSLAMFFMDARSMWGWKMLLHVFLAGIFCYLWLRTIGLRRGTALFGGLVYMMGADLVSLVYPGGDGKLFVSALAPLVFLLAERAVRSGRIADYAFFGLSIALVVFTSHMQLAYFTVWGVSLWFLFRLWQRRRELAGRGVARNLALYALAGVLGVGAAAVQFLPPLQYLREWSHRTERTVAAEAEQGYEFATSYSLHGEEIVSLVVPEFPGADLVSEDRTLTRYWGVNPLKYNSEYAGLVPLLLLPLLFLGRREPVTWFLCGLGVLSLLYALGADTPFFRLFYLIPGVPLFRAPSLIIFLYSLSLATLSALAAQRLLDAGPASGETAPRIRRALWIGAGVLGVLALLESAGMVTSAWLAIFDVGPQRQQLLAGNLPAIRTGFWIAFLIGAGVAGTFEAYRAGLLGPQGALIALCIIAGLDLYRADRPYIEATVLYNEYQARGGSTLFEPDETIRFLQSRRDAGERFRTFDMATFIEGAQGYGRNDLAAHGIEQLAGHHGNEIGRYRELIGGEFGNNVLASEFRLLDLTNTRYIVSPGRLDPAAIPGMQEVFAGSRSVVYERPSVLPREYLVGRYEMVSDDRAVQRLLAPDFDMANAVVLADPPPDGIRIEPDPQGTVERIEETPDGYTLRVTTDRPALLVISENYFPAWHATVDGEAVPILRANYTFRALPVPAGTHEVTLAYRSEILGASAAISVTILLVLLGAGLAGYVPRRAGKGSG